MFPKDKLFNILRKKYGVLIVTAPGNNKNNNKSRNRKKIWQIHTYKGKRVVVLRKDSHLERQGA